MVALYYLMLRDWDSRDACFMPSSGAMGLQTSHKHRAIELGINCSLTKPVFFWDRGLFNSAASHTSTPLWAHLYT